jgi:hypothetical protein
VLWTARVAWIVLPFTTGAAVGEIIQPWSRVPEIIAAVLLWAAWFAGLVALLAPRPWGFTILRVVAPCALILAIVSAWSAPWPLTVLAIVTSGVALVTSLSSATAHACAASTAYGSERRFPLRVPVSLLAGPVPLSAVLVAAGIATGPLLLANGDIVAGVVAVVVGVPIAGALVRSLTALDHRWIVLVPAGLVVVDPLTFPDPVLLPREHIASVRRAPRSARVRVADRDPSEILVGGTGPLLVTCRETGTFLRRAGRGHVNLEADRLRVSPLRPDAVLLAVDAHRITIA